MHNAHARHRRSPAVKTPPGPLAANAAWHTSVSLQQTDLTLQMYTYVRISRPRNCLSLPGRAPFSERLPMTQLSDQAGRGLCFSLSATANAEDAAGP